MNRIKELRKKNNIKQVELAKHLGISQSTLSEWESEKYQIDNDNLFKLSDFFGVSIDYLLCRTNESVKSDNKDDTMEVDIQERLQDLLSQLETGKDGLMFSGDPLSDDSKELLAAALERILRLTKSVNKSEDEDNER